VRKHYASILVAILAIALVFTGCSRTPKEAIPGPGFEGAKEIKKINPQADAVIQRLSEYVRGLESFRVDVEMSSRLEMNVDLPDEARHTKTETTSTYSIALQRPNKLVIRRTTAIKPLELESKELGSKVICDGKHLYTYMPMEKKYTAREAPENLDEIVDEIDKAVGLSDTLVTHALLQSNPYKALMEGINQVEYLGTEEIDGVKCHHIKVSHDKADFEMWVDAGDKPLVKKIIPDISKMFADQIPQMMKDMKMEIVTVFKDWAVNVDLPDNLFKPEGEEKKLSATQPAARQILDKMAHAYSSCKSYKDEGVVTTVFFDSNGRKRTTKKPFTTAFVRPGRFRFEFKERRGEEEWDRYIVWRDGKSVRTWWSVRPGINNLKSLSMALSGATGVSGGSAHRIPSLLMPDELVDFCFTHLTDLELLDDEDVDGVLCFKIQGKDFRGEVNTLWIEKRSYLVWKIVGYSKFPDFRTETTTTYKPQFNVDVRPEELEFNPPVKEVGP